MGSESQGERGVVSGTAATVEGAPLKNAAPVMDATGDADGD